MVHFYLLIPLFKGFNGDIKRPEGLNKSFCIVCFGRYLLALFDQMVLSVFEYVQSRYLCFYLK